MTSSHSKKTGFWNFFRRYIRTEDPRWMRKVATGLLILCAAGMVVCRLLETSMPFFGFLRAIFEAATIGAMADWFAVVALFRHPMGLPIPHTAILPNNKSRVADSLANFIESSFLTEEQLGPKIRGMDYAGMASRWLEANASMLAEKAAKFAPDVLAGLSDAGMAGLLESRARDLIRKTEVGPMAAEGLEVIVQNGRDREIFLSVMKAAHKLIEEHRPTIQSKISREIPISGDMLRSLPLGKEFVGPLLDQLRENIASAVAAKTIEKVQAALDEAGQEHDSPLWHSFDQRLRKFITGLKSSPEMASKIHTMQDSLAQSKVVGDFAAKTWLELKEFLLRDCAEESSTVRRKIEEAVLSSVRQLDSNPAARQGINKYLGDQILAAALNLRPQARELVVSTINAWDAEEMARRLEETVGADLQFIRFNGTIVGGLIGGAIYGLFWIFGKVHILPL